MKKPSEHWEDNLGKRLQNLQPDTSIRSWERLEAALEEKPKQRPWLLIAAGIALLMAPAAFWLWQSNHGSEITPQPVAIQQSHQINDNAVTETNTLHNSKKEAPASAAATTSSASNTEAGRETKHVHDHTKSAPIDGAHASSAQLANGQNPVVIADAQNSKRESVQEIRPIIEEANLSIAQKTSTTVADSISGKPGVNKASIAAATTPLGVESSAISQQAALPPTSEMKAVAQSAQHTIAAHAVDANQLQLAMAISPDPIGVPGYTIKVPKVNIQRPLGLVLREAALAKAEVAPVKKKGASLWVEALPTLSYYMLEPTKTDNVMVSSVQSEPALSGSRLGGQVAAGFTLPVLKKLAWKSGGYYWYQQQHLSYTYANAKPDAFAFTADANGMSRIETVHTPQSTTIDMPLHNLGVSTGLSYKVSEKGLQSFLETELMAHYNVHQKISSFVSLGYAIKTRFISKTSLKVGPAVQYQLNSSEALSPHFKDKPISFGLQLGVGFNE